MTIANETNRNQHTATAGQTTFSYSFKIEADDEIVVYQTPAANDPDDANDILVLTTNYSVTGVGDAGGNIVLVSGATVDDVITLARNVTINQADEYVTGQDHAEELEASLDRITMRLQQIDEQVNRALKTELTDGSTYTLPKPEAGLLLGWNATEDGLQNVSGSEPIDASVVAAAESAAAALVSENNAATSETNAATSETNAASSASAALTNAGLASISAGNAAASASAASTSASAAATSASQASTSASNAATSETNAAADAASIAGDVLLTAADVVSTNADVVSTNANAATTAQDAIDTAADVVATNQDTIDTAADVVLTNNKYSEFDDRYLGSKAAAPTTLNDGTTALDSSHEGIEYWNSVTNDRWTWTGSVWTLTSGTAATSANNVSIADSGGYYDGNDVEAALQELGSNHNIIDVAFNCTAANNTNRLNTDHNLGDGLPVALSFALPDVDGENWAYAHLWDEFGNLWETKINPTYTGTVLFNHSFSVTGQFELMVASDSGGAWTGTAVVFVRIN